MHTVIYVLCTMLYMTFILNTIIKKILYIPGSREIFSLVLFLLFSPLLSTDEFKTEPMAQIISLKTQLQNRAIPFSREVG